MSSVSPLPRYPRGRLDWFAAAACAGHDTDLWHPSKGETTPQAKAICGGCPVRDECLSFALAFDEQHGVWGGLSARERMAIDRGRFSCPECGRRFPTANGRAIHRRVHGPRGPDHGSKSSYNMGCRCDECRAANNEYARRTRRSTT